MSAAPSMTLAIAALLAVLGLALLTLWLRARRISAAHAAATAEAAALAEAVAGLATATAFTLRVTRDGRYAASTVLGALHSWLGYEDDETTPREAWRLLVHPDDRPVVEQALRQALGGEPVECDVRYVPTRGEPRRLRLGLRPERDRWGWVHAIHGVLREPPERPALDAELEEARERLREAATQADALRASEQRRQAHEHQLAVTATMLDGLFGNAPLAILYADRDFRLLRVNPFGARRMETIEEMLIGRRIAEVAPDIWRQVEPHFRAVLADGMPVTDVQLELHGPRGDRPEPRTYLMSVFPVRAADGTISGVGAFANDITDRTRFDVALRASERYLRDLADAMPQIVFILGADLQCEFVNRRFAEFTGLDHSPEALQSCVHPEDWTEARARIRASMAAGQPHADEVRMREAATGYYRWFLLRTVPQLDGEGRVTRWFGTATDIHDQKRVQRALAYAEARQRALADAAVKVTASLSLTKPLPETLQLVADLGREVVGASEARLSAVPETDGGFAFRIASRAPEAEAADGHRLPLADPARNGTLTVPIAARDGQSLGTLEFAGRFEGAFTAEDEAVAVQLATMAAVALENSDLVQRIRDDDQRKDEFLATLAHELRNPLAPIANSLELLRYAEQDEQVLQRARGTMERQMGQMVHLIDDLLDASRISRGRLTLRRERVALQEVIAHALEAVRPALDRARQFVDVDLPHEPIRLDADPTRLTQVFTNLLDNAAKFSERSGRITVAATVHGAEVTVRVSDAGVGIPADKLATIFDMFAQVDHSVERSAGGLGIGLALVRGLVEMHGGRIEAASEGTGKGTEMRVTLPLEASPATPAAASEAAALPHVHRRILVADDNQDSADSLVALLRLSGHEAHAVYDGESAVAAAARLQPDIVLLDLGMPRVSGHEVALRIREGPARAAALVALTGWGDERTRQRTREEGFDDHLTKPVEFQQLLEVIARI